MCWAIHQKPGARGKRLPQSGVLRRRPGVTALPLTYAMFSPSIAGCGALQLGKHWQAFRLDGGLAQVRVEVSLPACPLDLLRRSLTYHQEAST